MTCLSAIEAANYNRGKQKNNVSYVLIESKAALQAIKKLNFCTFYETVMFSVANRLTNNFLLL